MPNHAQGLLTHARRAGAYARAIAELADALAIESDSGAMRVYYHAIYMRMGEIAREVLACGEAIEEQRLDAEHAREASRTDAEAAFGFICVGGHPLL